MTGTAPIACAREPYPTEPYAFHKARFRDTAQHPQLRKESALWLIAMGVVFDNDKFIDPEVLPE